MIRPATVESPVTGKVAERASLRVNTIKAYSQDTPRRMPNPDAMIGRVKGWKVETIDAWHARHAT